MPYKAQNTSVVEHRVWKSDLWNDIYISHKEIQRERERGGSNYNYYNYRNIMNRICLNNSIVLQKADEPLPNYVHMISVRFS